MSASQNPADVKAEARAALEELDRDAQNFVLGALVERVPEDFLAAVQLYQTVLGGSR